MNPETRCWIDKHTDWALWPVLSLWPAVAVACAALFRHGASPGPASMTVFLLCAYALTGFAFRKFLAPTPRRRLRATLWLMLYAAVPLLFLWDELPLPASPGGQAAVYCVMQAAWFAAVRLFPGALMRRSRRRYEERVLAGRGKFESRCEVVAARRKAAAERAGQSPARRRR